MARSIVPMLHVADVEDSERFYRLLGFVRVSTNRAFDPAADRIDWILLERSGAQLMLNAGGSADASRRDITLSIDVEDVDALRASLPSELTLEYEPRDQFYGRRDFELRDPSGFRVLLGQAR